jgi:isocitrate/isopropylmalate dehydrogenase
METPKGTGAKSVNVTARKVWNAFANKRVFKSLPGVQTVFSRAGIPIDLTLFRENIEVCSSDKLISGRILMVVLNISKLTMWLNAIV